MKILVSGGTGLIGSRLVEALAASGHEVVVLSRSPQKYTDQFSGDVQLVQWNGRDVGPWAQHVNGATAVVNLAGENIAGSGFLPDRWTDEKRRRIRESRSGAGDALVAAVESAAQKPQFFLQASAIGYYGSTGDALITESSPAGTGFLASVVVDWEASTAAVEAMGVRRAVARIGLVQSADEGALPRLLLPARLFAGGWFGSGEQYWSWIHLTDAVRALYFLVENGTIQGPVNVTAPNPVTNKEFGKTLGDVLNRPAAFPVPAFALRTALGEVASTVLEGQRVIPEVLQQAGFTFEFPQLREALQDLVHEHEKSGNDHQPATV